MYGLFPRILGKGDHAEVRLRWTVPIYPSYFRIETRQIVDPAEYTTTAKPWFSQWYIG